MNILLSKHRIMVKSYNNGYNSTIPSTPYFLLVGSLAVGGGGGPLLSSSSRYDIRMSALSSLSGSMMWYLLSLQSTSSISSMWFPSLLKRDTQEIQIARKAALWLL